MPTPQIAPPPVQPRPGVAGPESRPVPTPQDSTTRDEIAALFARELYRTDD